jgi:tetratricopeptide (TPR) repeat protein
MYPITLKKIWVWGYMDTRAFISYRRGTSWQLARAIVMALRTQNIDAFMDVDTMGAGQFDTILLREIAQRRFFLPLLTPGSLDRCINSGDWVRREIEEALKLKQPEEIIPLYTSDFKFEDIDAFLTAPVAAQIKRYNAIEMHQKYFDASIAELRRFMFSAAVPVAAAVDTLASAEAYYDRALKRPDTELDLVISDCTEVIRRDPGFAKAYNLRGGARLKRGDVQAALTDFNDAIRLDPKFVRAYKNRAVAREQMSDIPGALKDYDQVLYLSPGDKAATDGLGRLRPLPTIRPPDAATRMKTRQLTDLELVIADCTEAIRLAPHFAKAYAVRGIAYWSKKDYTSAIADCTAAIACNPQFIEAYKYRTLVRYEQGDLEGAYSDLQQVIKLDPNDAWAQETMNNFQT